jgi:spermidine synthase
MPQLLTLESPFPEQNHTLRLLEPPGTCEIGLGKQLLEGTYNKPFIVDCGALRYLHFDLDKVRKSHALR